MQNIRRSLVIAVTVMFCLLNVQTAVMAEELIIVGTGSGTAILKSLADAFHQIQPEITITIPESIGSGGGIKAVGRDEYLLGRVARPIKEQEQPYELVYRPYALDPIVFFTNTSVAVKNLTPQQILDIYSGAIDNWKEVDGPDAKIRVVSREEGDSSRDVLHNTFPGFKDLMLTSKAKITFSDPETEETVLTTEGVIAYGSYSNAKSIHVNVLDIGEQSALDKDYPYTGILAFVYKKQNYTGTVKAFVEFATSEAAHAAIQSVGGLPMR